MIDIYSTKNGYEILRRCYGHSSYITHIDWSADSTVFQSNCGAYEILYWDAKMGSQSCSNHRDTRWAEWTCPLGFPVMGVFPSGCDGTDIDCLCRSYGPNDPARQKTPSQVDPLQQEGQRLVVTGDDKGLVRLYTYPCVAQRPNCRIYTGHSSHVRNIRFAYDNRCVCSFPWMVPFLPVNYNAICQVHRITRVIVTPMGTHLANATMFS
jgi:WD40 repeat protein